MFNYEHHLIKVTSKVRESMSRLNDLGDHLTLFVLDMNSRLLGTVTDGDIRRGLIGDVSFDDTVDKIMNKSFKYLNCNGFTLQEIQVLRAKRVKLLPLIDESGQIVKIVNFEALRSIIPVEAVVMAGGEGVRLRPLTLKTPKPLITIGEKSILDHTLERLMLFGIDNISLIVRYLGEQVIEHCSTPKYRDLKLRFVTEVKPLGTIGGLSLISEFAHDAVLLMNSDVLTNLDLEDFYLEFTKTEADMVGLRFHIMLKFPMQYLKLKRSKLPLFGKSQPTPIIRMQEFT